MTAQLRTAWALIRRALNEILRVPGAAIPGVLAPSIFMLGMAAVFGKAAELPGYPTANFLAFVLPVGLLQGAGFTGAATGVNLARDMEHGWFDRLLVAPLRRPTLLVGIVLSASMRVLIPATFLLVVGFVFGVDWPGILGLLIVYVLVTGLAAVSACWGTTVAVRFKSQQAAPLMQVGSFVAVLFTTAYAPKDLLTGWLKTIATINPVTHVLDGVRQGFIGQVTWAHTWPAFVALVGLLAFFGLLALRGLARAGR